MMEDGCWSSSLSASSSREERNYKIGIALCSMQLTVGLLYNPQAVQ